MPRICACAITGYQYISEVRISWRCWRLPWRRQYREDHRGSRCCAFDRETFLLREICRWDKGLSAPADSIQELLVRSTRQYRTRIPSRKELTTVSTRPRVVDVGDIVYSRIAGVRNGTVVADVVYLGLVAHIRCGVIRCRRCRHLEAGVYQEKKLRSCRVEHSIKHSQSYR